MDIVISSRRLLRILLCIFFVLLMSHLCVQGLRFWSGDRHLFGLIGAFSLGLEQNFPTYFSTVVLLACSALLGFLGISELSETGRLSRYWFGLGFIFLFLSMDEMMMMHERLTDPVRALIGESHVPHFEWVLPYGLFVLLFCIAYARFLFRLPLRTALFFVIAGSVYVGGAIGVETMSGLIAQERGTSDIMYVTLQTIEETMEMLGAIFFLYALADYSERKFGPLSIRFKRDRQPISLAGETQG